MAFSYGVGTHGTTSLPLSCVRTLLVDVRSIDNAMVVHKKKKGTFIVKTFQELRNEVSHALPAPLSQNPFYCGLELSLIQSKGVLGLSSRYGMWHLILKLLSIYFLILEEKGGTALLAFMRPS